MPDRDIIHEYLKSLSKYLSRLETRDAEDVIREIESHIYDVLETHEADGSQINAEAILTGFGQPRELAAQYVEHILAGSPPPRGFRAIQRVKKGATKSLYYVAGIFGYGLSLILILVGLLKIIMPEIVGFWVSESGNTIVLGALSDLPGGTYEILGWWAVPVTIGLGTAAAYLTRRIIGVLREKI
jgi:uncharacterized membrane protein